MPVTNRATVSRCSEDPPWVGGDLHSAKPGAMSSSVVCSIWTCLRCCLQVRAFRVSGTPSPPLPRLYADNPDRGRAANCRGRGKNLEFAMELLLRERLLGQPRPALSIFKPGCGAADASAASQFRSFPP